MPRYCLVLALLLACRPEPSSALVPEDDGAGGAMGAGGAASEGLPAEAEGCGAQPVTLAELHSGRVRSGIVVALPRLLASSQKFLVSEAKSGSCLWGAFAADPMLRGAGSGVLLVSFGPDHAAGQACPSGADGLPDDLAPGDVLQAQGMLDDFVPAACDGVAPAAQLRVEPTCPVQRVRRGEPPEPEIIGLELAGRLAEGKEPGLLRAWGGALVRMKGVSAVQDAADGDAVFPFGVVRLEQTPLEVHSRLYYFDLSEGGPRATIKAPRLAYPAAFTSITGLVFLDYCSWVLAPRDRCRDMQPSSGGCRDQARGP
jgi:hypothetical protein